MLKRSGLALFHILVVSTAFAEDAPSIDQTWEYLESAFKEDQRRNVQEQYDFFPSVTFDKTTCEMNLQISDGSIIRGEHILFLKDLDPSLVTVQDYTVDYVNLGCREKKQCVTNKFANGETYQVTSLTVVIDDAERNAKAFTHLIKLCGGQEELF